MNQAELNAILFYADYLSLNEISLPVTDNCKYFYVYGVPMNTHFILNNEPEFDKENLYFKQAVAEYTILRDKFGDEGVASFIDDVCCIKACGMVDAVRMLKCIHQFSTKKERKQAFDIYNTWKNNLTFSHTTFNEDGDPKEKQCSRYVYYAEKMLGRPLVAKSV